MNGEFEITGTKCNCGVGAEECVYSAQSEEMEPGEQPDSFVITGRVERYEMRCRECGATWTEYRTVRY